MYFITIYGTYICTRSLCYAKLFFLSELRRFFRDLAEAEWAEDVRQFRHGAFALARFDVRDVLRVFVRLTHALARVRRAFFRDGEEEERRRGCVCTWLK